MLSNILSVITLVILALYSLKMYLPVLVPFRLMYTVLTIIISTIRINTYYENKNIFIIYMFFMCFSFRIFNFFIL